MGLYQEILFLQHFFKGKYCIENVKPYYEPLIKPQYSGRHCFWANFPIPKIASGATVGKMCGENQGENRKKLQSDIGRFGPVKSLGGKRTEGLSHHKLGFDLTGKDHPDKSKLLNNCVVPEIGLAIFESALNIYNHNAALQIGLFAKPDAL